MVLPVLGYFAYVCHKFVFFVGNGLTRHTIQDSFPESGLDHVQDDGKLENLLEKYGNAVITTRTPLRNWHSWGANQAFYVLVAPAALIANFATMLYPALYASGDRAPSGRARWTREFFDSVRVIFLVSLQAVLLLYMYVIQAAVLVLFFGIRVAVGLVWYGVLGPLLFKLELLNVAWVRRWCLGGSWMGHHHANALLSSTADANNPTA